MEFELKTIHEDAVDRSLDKADTYRLLNDPQQAESICLDVLALDETNERARRILVLALTDQFADSHSTSRTRDARKLARGLSSEYEQHYYLGLIAEREARAFLRQHRSGSFAYEAFEVALEHYAKAEALREKGDDDAILRWNACVREIHERNLEPRGHEPELPLE